jgi:hypothetical protein
MTSPVVSRRLLLAGLWLPALGWPLASHALCASPAEAGRWRNIEPKETDPAFLDVRMTSCGDQVLNGQQTETAYKLRVWIRQSSGQFYGRPSVAASYKTWKGQRWMMGRVPTGGYIDNVWMRSVQNNGQRQLHVLIRHESLDSKPSSTTEHWFRYEKAV